MGKGKMKALNKAMVELVEEYGAVSFETLAVEVSPFLREIRTVLIVQDKKSMLKLLRIIDKSNGYIHLPGQSDTGVPELGAMPDLEDLGTVEDVQERWGPNRALYDREEEEAWEKEWQLRAGTKMGPAATVIRPDEAAVREREQAPGA
jgi:hypothetical protein